MTAKVEEKVGDLNIISEAEFFSERYGINAEGKVDYLNKI